MDLCSKRRVMPTCYRVATLLMTSALVACLPGCLNLGGRTTNVHDNPQTNGRLSALETRVSALEQAFQTTSVEVPAPVQSYNSPGRTTPAAP